METAVLSARDHLAEYRHHARTVPGVASPVGANPRSRRKSGKTTPQVAIASMMSDAAWYLTGDISVGVLRGLAASGSGSPARLVHSASSPPPSSSKSSSNGLHVSFFGSSQSALQGSQFNGAGSVRSGVLPKPAAVLERVHGKKVSEKRGSEAAVLDRTSDKKPQERGRAALDKRPAKGSSDGSGSERRPDVLDRRPERKISERERGSPNADNYKGRQDSERSTSSSKQRSAASAAPVITILKRPQTKEAAAENLAIITGVPLSEIYKNGLPAPPPAALAEASVAKDISVSKGLLTADEITSSVEAVQGDGQSSTHQGPTVALDASPAKKVSLLQRKSKGEAVAKDVPSSKSLLLTGDERRSSVTDAAEEGDGQSSTHQEPIVALDASPAKKVSLLLRKSQVEAVAKDVPLSKGLLTADETRSSVADAAEEGDGQSSRIQGSTVASDASTAKKVSLLHRKSKVEAAAKDVPLSKGLLSADEIRSSVVDAAEEGDGQSSAHQGPTVALDASTVKKGSLTHRKSKGEAPLKGVAPSSKDSEVVQVEDVGGDIFDGQRSVRASSSRERRSDNAQQRPVRVKGKDRKGDSPVKESARTITKVREKSGSPRGRSAVGQPVLVSPGSISSVSGHSLKSSSGSFGFLDSLSDIFFSPANERWAGPAYSNSPPPSSLPMPKFSLHKLRDSAAGQ